MLSFVSVCATHGKCASISKINFKALENSQSPFGLQEQVGGLERKVANDSVDHTPLVVVNETENQPITNPLVDSESKAVIH